MGLMSSRRVGGTGAARALCEVGRSAVVGRGIAMLLAVAGVLALWCGSAQAKLTHPYISSFRPSGYMEGIAVESGSGTVYVYDGFGSVYKFDASGSPVNFASTGTNAISVGRAFYSEGEIAVDSSSGPAKGDIYIAHADGSVEIFSATGAKLGELSEEAGDPWGEACGVAVDASGAVYVGLYGSHVNKYVPSANPVTNADYVSSLEGLSSVCNVAADSAGNVFAVTWNSGPVTRYEPGQFGSLSAAGSEVDAKGSMLAVDPANDEVYVDEGNRIAQFGPHGEPFNAPVLTFAGSGQGAISGSFGVGVAVSGFNHDVYVSDGAGDISVFGPAVMLPTVVTGGASKVSSETATATGTVNPEGLPVSECFFEYGENTAYGKTAPCQESSGEIGAGSGPVSVHATLTGLASGVTYHYRLVAANSNGSAAGEDAQYEFGPVISEEFVTDVTATSATFHGQVNPMGNDTTYRFEYGPSTSYGSSTPEGNAGSGLVGQPVQANTQDLQASSPYHYRLVGSNSVGTTYGPDQTLTTQSVGSELRLADHRQWEMVSPSSKEGALFAPIDDPGLQGEGIIQASVRGDAIAYLASNPTEAQPQGYSNYVSVLSTRGSSGWLSQTIAPPHEEGTFASVGKGQEYRFFSEDLSYGIVQPFGNFTPLSAEASESTAYLHTDYLNGDVNDHCLTGCFKPLVMAANVPAGTKFGEEPEGECPHVECGPLFVGATPDASHVVLTSPVALTETSTQGTRGVYEWTGNRLQLVSVLPEGETNYQGGSAAGQPAFGEEDSAARNAISTDGSRVIWKGEGSAFHRHLYLRDTTEGKTIRLDVFQGVPKGSESSVPRYMTASTDGSRVFFTDSEKLTPRSSSEGWDLYEYNLDAPAGSELTDLSVDGNAGERAEVTNVLGSSTDGSYVYFAAGGALAPGANAGECGGVSFPLDLTKRCNLYVSHNGVTTFIAALSENDYPSWAGHGFSSLSEMTARVSPGGRWLSFMSERNLVGYDARDAVNGEPDEEVYLYDAGVGRLTCVSCDPTGARPVGQEYGSGLKLVGGDRVWQGAAQLASLVPPWTRFNLLEARYQSRYLSDSGRMFFDSRDALVPQDVNGTWDVYEYEPVGVGDCTKAQTTFSEASGGCVSLISSGTSGEESAFLDASEGGGDVFFLTTASLRPQDYDQAVDVYDAHECTSQAPCFPATPVSPPSCDTGESCKPAQSAQPSIFGPGPSQTFSGTGNVASAPEKAVGRSLSRAQRLARALKACRHAKGKRKRAACKRRARKRYGKKGASRARLGRAKRSTRGVSARTGR